MNITSSSVWMGCNFWITFWWLGRRLGRASCSTDSTHFVFVTSRFCLVCIASYQSCNVIIQSKFSFCILRTVDLTCCICVRRARFGAKWLNPSTFTSCLLLPWLFVTQPHLRKSFLPTGFTLRRNFHTVSRQIASFKTVVGAMTGDLVGELVVRIITGELIGDLVGESVRVPIVTSAYYSPEIRLTVIGRLASL